MKIQDIDKSFDFVNTKSIFTLLFTFVVVTIYGQNIPQPQFEVTDSTVDLSIAIDAVIEDLDLSDVTTNILYDRGWKLGSLDNFDGTTTSDTVRDHAAWLRQYGSLVTAYRGTPAASPVPSITTWKAQRNAAVANGKNPLVMMHIGYNQFLTDSVLLSTLIYENNGKLEDYPNQSTSPFEEQTAFSFSPYLSTVYDSLSLNFQTDPLFFKSNYGSTVSTIHVDFDNGSGYQSIGTNGSVKVSWSTFGTKTLKLKVAYANGQTFYAKSTLNLVQTPNYRPPGAKSNSFADHKEPISHPSDPAYTAELQIEYACGHDKLVKPYIFVEGFSPIQFQANKTYADYYYELLNYQQEFSSDYQLLDELFENGYDIVYVDFAQGTGDIIKNAEVLVEAIKWVNDEKAANGSTEPNVVVGYSMGGLIARLGIRYLELDNNENPDVSYYISVDAPHVGANVPLGLRFAIEDLYENVSLVSENLGEYEEGFQDAYDVLHSPAARQMLLYSFDSFFTNNSVPYWDNTTRINFWNELDGKGMPTSTIENIAIAKGNGTGTEQHFGSLDPLLDADIQNNYDCFDDLVNIYDLIHFDTITNQFEQDLEKFLNLYVGATIQLATIVGVSADLELDINAMPGHVPELYQIYERRLQFRILWIVPVGGSHMKIKIGSAFPYDSSPGSTYSVGDFATGDGDLAPLLNGDYAPCIEVHEQDFCFIPTFSALNVISLATSPYTQIDPESIVTNDQTTFDKCFLLNPTLYPPNTAPTNESHISFSPSNINPFEEYISPDFNAVNENPTVNGYIFNFGSAAVGSQTIRTTDRINHPLTVGGLSSAHGGIWVNRDDRLANKNDTDNPYCDSEHFLVELTRSCNYTYGRVTIDEYGSMVIGEDQNKTADVVVRENAWINLNDGFIEVRPGSNLIIEDGGELRLNGGMLRVQNGGEVIIKEGGKLIFEDGASIELNGDDAVLALGGLTEIGDNAVFTFGYQGTESGYVRMTKEGHWGQRFYAGTNARVHLQGEGQDDLILYMEETVDFWEYKGSVDGYAQESKLFEHVEISDGLVEMEHSARMVLINSAEVINVRFERAHASDVPRGVVPMNLCEVRNSTFNKVKLYGKLYYYQNSKLRVYNTEFTNSTIEVRGGGYYFKSCDFHDSSIHGTQSNRKNKILYSHIHGGGVWDDSDAELFLYKTIVEYSDDGVQKDGDRLTVRCCTFTDNEVGIVGTDMATINLSTPQGGGNNYFNDNGVNVGLIGAYDVLLADGYNEMYDATYMNISGSLDRPAPPCPSINATKNIWTPATSTTFDPNYPDDNEFDVYVGVPIPNGIVCHVNVNFGTVADNNNCALPILPTNHGGPTEGKSNNDAPLSSYPAITTPVHFNETPLDIAVLTALSFTTDLNDSLGDDFLAADMYYELLMADVPSVNDSMDAVAARMRSNTIFSHKATIENLFSTGLLTADMNQTSFVPALENYAEVLMKYSDKVKVEATYREQFKLEMAKASLFKTIGKQELALQIVENVANCDHDSLQETILEKQRQNLIFDIASREAGMDAFLMDSVVFELDSSIFDLPVESFVDSSGFGAYIHDANTLFFSRCYRPGQPKGLGTDASAARSPFKVFPNPTTGNVIIWVKPKKALDSEKYVFDLYDVHGKHCFSMEIEAGHSQLGLPELDPALYYYTVSRLGTAVHRGKLMVVD